MRVEIDESHETIIDQLLDWFQQLEAANDALRELLRESNEVTREKQKKQHEGSRELPDPRWKPRHEHERCHWCRRAWTRNSSPSQKQFSDRHRVATVVDDDESTLGSCA